MMPSRPNILYLFADQHAAAAMGCAGNADVRTPTMDALAARGVRFDRAYCTYPLCTPARASMFTGLMPHQVGIVKNGQPIAEEHRTAELGHVLSAQGYDCVYGGKWHVPEIVMPDGHGFRIICGYSDWELPTRCAEYIAEPHAAPFFLVASFDNPHNICEWSRGQALPWGNVAEAPVATCPNLPANFAIPPYEPEAIRVEQRANRIYRADGYTPDDWRQYRHAYYRLVEKVDAGIAVILDALEQAGLAENTLIIFSSDHGDGMGAHQWNQKSVLYEESVRVPFIVVPPGGMTGRVDTRLVSNGLDLYPTVCDYAGVPVPDHLPGASVRQVLEGTDGAWRDHLVVETVFDAGASHGLMLRTAQFKYCVYGWGKYREQLFDLDADPGEMTNLAVNARYADELQRHRDLLSRWITDTNYRTGAHYAHPEQRPVVPGEEYV